MEKFILKEPASYGQLIRFSLQVYRRSFNKVLLFSVFLSLIIFLPRLIGDITQTDLFFMKSIFDPKRLWFLLVDFLALILLVAILWDIHCLLFGIKDPIIQDFKMGLRKFLYVLVASFIQAILVFASLFIVYGFQTIIQQSNHFVMQGIWGTTFIALIFGLQIAFIVYVATLFIFYIPIIATENKGIFNALERSISLVWNHWWRTLSVQLTPWFYYAIVLLVLKYVLGLNVHFYFTERREYNFQITVLHFVVFTFFIPWIASVLLVQLHDLELRKKLQIEHGKK